MVGRLTWTFMRWEKTRYNEKKTEETKKASLIQRKHVKRLKAILNYFCSGLFWGQLANGIETELATFLNCDAFLRLKSWSVCWILPYCCRNWAWCGLVTKCESGWFEIPKFAWLLGNPNIVCGAVGAKFWGYSTWGSLPE